MQRVVDFRVRLNQLNFLRLLQCIAVASLLCSSASIEARAQYRFDHFTNRNGLPQNTVSAITQTTDGYLWFATYDGLVRYDGLRFTVFDKGNTPGLLTNQLLSLWGDDEGTYRIEARSVRNVPGGSGDNSPRRNGNIGGK